ncbi:MAG: hypothetical protein II849_04295 [Bacteroidales bacterium]|nr:hypothetical protein [Bacteroidales bacterium]
MRLFAMAALTLAAVAATGCSKDDEHIESTGKVVVSTTTVSLTDGTKALNSQGEKTFSTGDEVAVVYENTSGTLVKATVTLAEADISNGGKTASITVSMTAPKADGTVRIIYPAAMATAGGDVNYSALANQDGKLTTIARSLDLALYEGSLSGTNLPDIPTLDNPLAVCEFQIKNTTGSTDLTPSITMLYIADGTNSYYLGGLSDLSSIWVVMKPVASGATLTFHAAAGTTRYVKEISGKTLAAGNMYHVAVGTTQLREGALFGTFSVSGTKKVHFSQGNLKYTNGTWSFHTNQYDYMGGTSHDVSESGSTDLFGWVGASSTWTGVKQYGVATEGEDALNKEDGYGNVAIETLKANWGTLAISNGGNTTNSGWHTLTGGNSESAEWNYLFNKRSSALSKYGSATVCGIVGTVVLPDNWTLPGGCSFASGMGGWDHNSYDATTWPKMEAAGAVFLPAAGYREGTSVIYVEDYGNYWSSSVGDENAAGSVFFDGNRLRVGNYDDRFYGQSVRLVCE